MQFQRETKLCVSAVECGSWERKGPLINCAREKSNDAARPVCLRREESVTSHDWDIQHTTGQLSLLLRSIGLSVCLSSRNQSAFESFFFFFFFKAERQYWSSTCGTFQRLGTNSKSDEWVVGVKYFLSVFLQWQPFQSVHGTLNSDENFHSHVSLMDVISSLSCENNSLPPVGDFHWFSSSFN